MNVLAAVQGQLRGARSLAWNPVPIPPSLQTTEVADVAICIFTDGTTPQIQYGALRYASSANSTSAVFVDQVLLQSKSQGPHAPVEVKWTRHTTASGKHPLGVLSYSYSVSDDAAVATHIAFYDAYIVIGSLAGQLLKQPNTPLPVVCANTHGYLGSMALPKSHVTQWQPDGRWTDTVAVGSADGTLYFGDIASLSPGSLTTLKAPGSVKLAQGPVLSLNWHHQAMSKDILLVGSGAGFAVVHVRSLKILMAPTDTHRRQNVTGVVWLENGNSVAVTYNDDETTAPTGILQCWDLRRSTHPYKEIASHHHGGVLGLVRSSIDPRFFVSVSKDGRMVTWATYGSNAVAYSDISIGQPATGFALLPCAGLCTVLTGETICVRSLDEHVVSESLKFPPNWILGNNALALGFGGKLAYLHTHLNSATNHLETNLGICHLPCDDSFVKAVEVFAEFLGRNDLGGYCQMRSQEARTLADSYEADIWSLLAAAFLTPSERIPILLDVLGHNANDIQRHAQVYLGHPAGAGIITTTETVNQQQSSITLESGVPEDSPTEHEAASFFDKLAGSNTVDENPLHSNEAPVADGKVRADLPSSTNGYIVDRDWSQGPLKLLKELFLVGQPLGAIECAMQANDFGLAFMIACSLDNKVILQTVKEKFVEFNKQSFVGVIANSSEDDFEAVIKNCVDLGEEWKDVAALLVTYPLMQEVSTQGTMLEFQRLCTMLARRLADDGDLMSAIPCYLVAGTYAEAVKLIANMPSAGGGQALKILVLRCLMNQSQILAEQDYQTDHTVRQFLTRLVDSGHIGEALTLLNLIGNDIPSTSQLRALIEETQGHTAQVSPNIPVYSIEPAPSYLLKSQAQQMRNTQIPSQPAPAMMMGMPQQRPPSTAPPPQAGMMQSFVHQMSPQMSHVPPSMMGRPGMPPPPTMPPTQAPMSSIMQMPSIPQMNKMTAQASSAASQAMHTSSSPPPPSMYSGMPQAAPQQSSFHSGMQPYAPLPPAAPMLSSPGPMVPSPAQPMVQLMGHSMAPPVGPPMAPPVPQSMAPSMGQPIAAPQQMQAPRIPQPIGHQPPPPVDDWPKSTHPAAAVSHVQPGMPTPWPLPTVAQKTHSVASEKLNQQVQEATAAVNGVACSAADMMKIKTALDQAVARVPDPSKQPLLRNALQELYAQLAGVALSQEIIGLLTQFADALSSQNFGGAMQLAQQMISTAWNKNSRNWLSAMKKLALPNTYGVQQSGPGQMAF